MEYYKNYILYCSPNKFFVSIITERVVSGYNPIINIVFKIFKDHIK